MANLWTKFKDTLLGVDVEDDYDNEDDYDYEDENTVRPYRNNPGFNRVEREPVMSSPRVRETPGAAAVSSTSGPYLAYSNARRVTESEKPAFKKKAQVRFCHPKTLEEASQIVQNTRNDIVSIVDLYETEQNDPKMCQRIADFLGGAAYALDGDIIRHNNHMFAVVPEGADVSTQELVKEIKEKSINFSAMNW
ncbi:MAG: cell division protein SepF [Defluviitaleaceae bacterium]|nr:cell division protein SepF [Defluviitaleaceae bacterium]